MTRIKICGITTREDARAACDAGADAIGLVFADSPRRVTIEQARQIAATVAPFVSIVGVFMDQPIATIREVLAAVPLDWVQLHGDEPSVIRRDLGRRVIKRFNVLPGDTPPRLRERMAGWPADAYLLDPGTGSGRTFDWSVARGLDVPLIVSGGLHAGNVAQAVRALRPAGVDVSSGVECSPGRKDRDKMRGFVRAVRQADADVAG